jgi:hypothetical protein
MVADALYIEILHKILVCNSGAWVACRPSRPRCPLDWSVQDSHADWTACCSPDPVQAPDWTDWTIKNTGSCVGQWSWRVFLEDKRFCVSIIGIPEIANPIGSKYSAVLRRCGHQQVRDARVRVPQRSTFDGWITAGAGYVSPYTPAIE